MHACRAPRAGGLTPVAASGAGRQSAGGGPRRVGRPGAARVNAMDLTPTVLHEIRSPIGDAQVIEWTWPTPMDVTVCETRHMLEMSLPPLSTDGAGCFPEVAPNRFNFVGGMFLRPAGLALRARSTGGRIQVVRCVVDPQRYAEVVEREFAWSERNLRACLDLRSDVLKLLFQRLRLELAAPGLGSAALAEAYMTALMVEAARVVADPREPRAEGRLAAWQHRRIGERLAEDRISPTVRELAELCGVSPRHLLRLYRNLTGESVIAQIARAQADRARRLLADSDLPIKEIAARLGFSSPGSFSTAFRRATGVSPRDFRQRRGGD